MPRLRVILVGVVALLAAVLGVPRIGWIASAATHPSGSDIPSVALKTQAMVRNPQTGEARVVPLQTTTVSLGDGVFETLVFAEIPKDLLNALGQGQQSWWRESTAAAASMDVSKTDSSVSVKGWLRLVWYEHQGGSATERHVNVAHNAAMWQNLDPQVDVTDSSLTSACWANFSHQPGFCDRQETYAVGDPIWGNWYSMSPSWSGVEVTVFPLQYASAASQAQLVRTPTGTTWTLQITACIGGSEIALCEFSG